MDSRVGNSLPSARGFARLVAFALLVLVLTSCGTDEPTTTTTTSTETADSNNIQVTLSESEAVLEVRAPISSHEAIFRLDNQTQTPFELGLVELAPDVSIEEVLEAGQLGPIPPDEFAAFGNIVVQSGGLLTVPDDYEFGRQMLVVMTPQGVAPLISFEDLFPSDSRRTPPRTLFSVEIIRIYGDFSEDS